MSSIEIVFIVFFAIGLVGLLVVPIEGDRWKNILEVIGAMLLYVKEKSKNHKREKKNVEKRLD
jgi:hypothetical protein